MDDDTMNIPLPTVAKLLAVQQADTGITDGELAAACGLPVTSITLIKDGKMKLPVGAIKRLAGDLNVEPRHFLRVVMNDYMPELLNLLEELRMPIELTKNEREALKKFRAVSNGRDAWPVVISGVTLVFPKSM